MLVFYLHIIDINYCHLSQLLASLYDHSIPSFRNKRSINIDYNFPFEMLRSKINIERTIFIVSGGLHCVMVKILIEFLLTLQSFRMVHLGFSSNDKLNGRYGRFYLVCQIFVSQKSINPVTRKIMKFTATSRVQVNQLVDTDPGLTRKTIYVLLNLRKL